MSHDASCQIFVIWIFCTEAELLWPVELVAGPKGISSSIAVAWLQNPGSHISVEAKALRARLILGLKRTLDAAN